MSRQGLVVLAVCIVVIVVYFGLGRLARAASRPMPVPPPLPPAPAPELAVVELLHPVPADRFTGHPLDPESAIFHPVHGGWHRGPRAGCALCVAHLSVQSLPLTG